MKLMNSNKNKLNSKISWQKEIFAMSYYISKSILLILIEIFILEICQEP